MAIWPEPSARRTRATAVFRRPVPIVYCFGAVFVSATCHPPVSRRTDFNPFDAEERIEIRSTHNERMNPALVEFQFLRLLGLMRMARARVNLQFFHLLAAELVARHHALHRQFEDLFRPLGEKLL